jgi:hypothetical protein
MAAMARSLKIADLKACCDRLLASAEALFGSEVDFDAAPAAVAEYWEVDTRSAYSLADSPELSVGNIADDLDEIQDLLHRQDDEIVLWHDLGHLTGLLRALAYLDLPGEPPSSANGSTRNSP